MQRNKFRVLKYNTGTRPKTIQRILNLHITLFQAKDKATNNLSYMAIQQLAYYALSRKQNKLINSAASYSCHLSPISSVYKCILTFLWQQYDKETTPKSRFDPSLYIRLEASSCLTNSYYCFLFITHLCLRLFPVSSENDSHLL